MFNIGILARAILAGAAAPYIAAVPSSLGGTASQTLSRSFEGSPVDGDLIVFLACCHWDSPLNAILYPETVVSTAGDTSTGVAWRSVARAYLYSQPPMGSIIQVQAPGITAGLYGVVFTIKGASTAGFESSSVKNATAGSQTPTFNSLSVTAGSLVLACSYFGDNTALIVNQGPEAGWTRIFSQGSTSGNDGRIVVDAMVASSTGTITPQSPRSSPLIQLWSCIAVSIPPP